MSRESQKVKVQYQATKEKEKKAKREAVDQVILQAMKRMREKKTKKPRLFTKEGIS